MALTPLTVQYIPKRLRSSNHRAAAGLHHAGVDAGIRRSRYPALSADFVSEAGAQAVDCGNAGEDVGAVLFQGTDGVAECCGAHLYTSENQDRRRQSNWQTK